MLWGFCGGWGSSLFRRLPNRREEDPPLVDHYFYFRRLDTAPPEPQKTLMFAQAESYSQLLVN